MDQDNRRTKLPELNFGAHKYLQMAMFVCLLANDDVINEMYGRRFTDCIIEDQRKYIAHLERPPRKLITPINASSNFSCSNSDDDGSSIKRHRARRAAQMQQHLASNSASQNHARNSVAFRRKVEAASKYRRAMRNQLLPEEQDETYSLSTLSSMRTTFDIFSPIHLMPISTTLGDCSRGGFPSGASYNSKKTKDEMRRDLCVINKGYFADFGGADMYKRTLNDANAKIKRGKSAMASPAPLASSQINRHCEETLASSSCSDVFEMGINHEPPPEKCDSPPEGVCAPAAPCVTTNLSIPAHSVPHNLSNKPIINKSTHNTFPNLKRPAPDTVSSVSQCYDTTKKMPKLIVTSSSGCSSGSDQSTPSVSPTMTLSKPDNIRSFSPINFPTSQPKPAQLQPTTAPRGSDLAIEEAMCAKTVSLIKNNPSIYFLLKNNMENFDQALEVLLSPIEHQSNRPVSSDEEKLESFPFTVDRIDPKNYNFDRVIGSVITNNYTGLSTDIEKIVASHSSAEFHAVSQCYSIETYTRLKEFRRKVRNKYAARMCRLKRLNETELLHQRNDILNEIIGILKFKPNPTATSVEKKAPKLLTRPATIATASAHANQGNTKQHFKPPSVICGKEFKKSQLPGPVTTGVNRVNTAHATQFF